MVTVTVAAIILAVGVPSFVSFVQNQRATTYTNELVIALNIGRSEATRRGTAVTVCASDDGATCSDDDDWSTGWIVATAAEVLRTWDAVEGGAGVIVGDADEVSFQPRGALSTPSVVLNVRVPDCSGDQGRDITVNRTGHVSVTRVACL
jgi:type IV fimbrial biogenesis protein FimT